MIVILSYRVLRSRGAPPRLNQARASTNWLARGTGGGWPAPASSTVAITCSRACVHTVVHVVGIVGGVSCEVERNAAKAIDCESDRECRVDQITTFTAAPHRFCVFCISGMTMLGGQLYCVLYVLYLYYVLIRIMYCRTLQYRLLPIT